MKLEKPQTLYLQLADELRARILDGTYGTNDALPSENALTELFGVSRITVRQAIALLADEGMVQRKQGKGTFVQALKVEQNFLGLHNFSHDLKEHGYEPSFEMLDYKRDESTKYFREMFGLRSGVDVHSMLRLKLCNSNPIMIERVALPADVFPELDPERVRKDWLSVILLEQYGARLRKARKTLQPLVIGQREAGYLQVSPGSIGLLVDRVTWDYDKSPHPIMITRSIVPAEHARFYVDLQYEHDAVDF